MNKVIMVIGAQYGDEGKGLITSYYCEKYKDENPLVIRFSGSAQAGHTVHYNGKKHIFSHFGSGTLQNVPTILTKEFVCHPMLFLKEHKILLEKGGFPLVHVDETCSVTTPFDMMYNQLIEESRGINRHGSCGIGFGATVDREIKYPLMVRDLYNKKGLKKILKKIQDYYILNSPFSDIMQNLSIDKFIEDCEYFISNISSIYSNIKLLSCHLNNQTLIFEGSQGLLLDPLYGKFPHVTRKFIGARVAFDILDQIENTECLVNINYLTRSYVTRHGNGPLPNETDVITQVFDIVDETNIHNKYQGSLRFAPFNYTKFKENIIMDFYSVSSRRYTKITKVMTCVDQITDQSNIFINVEKKFDLISKGPSHSDVIELSP